LSVERKKALASSLVDLETSKYRFWGFIFWFFGRIFKTEINRKRALF
jgi:hypothetical protein